MPVDEFRSRLGQITSRTEVQTLIAEAKSALHTIQLELETRGRGDHEWHRKAKYALRNVAERRRFMVVRLAEIPDPFRGERFDRIAKARELLETGKTDESLRIVIGVLSDFFEKVAGRQNDCHAADGQDNEP